MFAVVSSRPVELGHLMLQAPRSLCAQSRCDARGETHADGWGMGWYDDHGHPHAVHSTTALFEDSEYRRCADQTHAHMAIVHARQASVGTRQLANCHPFVHGQWMFAHNGTVTGFSVVRRQMEENMSRKLLSFRTGQTDSELVFYWLLSNLQREGVLLDERTQHDHADEGMLVDVLRESLHRLIAWCDESAEEPCKLNFYLTDGHVLATTRVGHSQYRLAHDEEGSTLADGVLPGEHCTVIASEPLDDGPWQEVPERSILTVRIHGQATVHPL